MARPDRLAESSSGSGMAKTRYTTMLGVGAVALVAPMIVPTVAHAGADSKTKCGSAVIEWSADDGKTWSRAGLLGDLLTKVSVRIADDVPKSCKYSVSLASYSTDGPSWKTSGTQRYLGSDKVSLSGKNKPAKLDIAKHAPPCFGQVDLYGNDKVFDGKKNPLPKYPDAKFPTDMIAGWNGGKKCAPPTTAPPSTAPPTTKPPTTTPPTTTPPTTMPPTTRPPTTAPPTTAPPTTKPPTATPAPSTAPPTTQPPVVEETTPPEEQRPPVTSPSVPGELADTGADDKLPIYAAASITAVLLGVGTLVLVRRRPHSRGPRNPWLS
jgi:hypothetical protein